MKNSEHSTKKKKNKKQSKENKNEIIDLNNEIVIGLVKKEEEKPKSKAKSKPMAKKKKANNKNKKNNSKKQKNKKTKAKLLILKWTSIVIVLTTAIILFLMSSVFNIKEINVINNNKVETQEIISLSGLSIGQNMLKTSKRKIENNLKQNSYIEEATIHRRISGKVNIEVKERIPTYMIKFANAYAYINNQGYILEISENALEIPTLEGIATLEENIKPGNRLEIQDLLKLQDVIKIMEAAKINGFDTVITNINISNSQNYILSISSEGKTIQFGDASDANIKFLKIKEVMDGQKNIEGEIYFQDKERTVFREKV